MEKTIEMRFAEAMKAIREDLTFAQKERRDSALEDLEYWNGYIAGLALALSCMRPLEIHYEN